MALKPIEEHVFGVKLFFKDYTNVIFFDKLIYCSKSMYILTFMTMINQVYIRVLVFINFVLIAFLSIPALLCHCLKSSGKFLTHAVLYS